MYLGIDIGGTTIKGGILNSNSELVHLKSVSTDSNSDSNSIEKNILEFISYYLLNFKEIKSIGIGVPGVVNYEGIIVVSPNIEEFENLNLSKIIKNELNLQIPLIMDNDANTAAFAELHSGAGESLESFIYVTLGTGVGGAIIHNRNIFKGISGGAGEIGHTIIDSSDLISGQFSDYHYSTLESLTGRFAIIKLYNQLLLESNLSIIDSVLDVKDIYEKAVNCDKIAIECFSIIGKYLGIGFSSAMNLLDIPYIIIGGGVSLAWDYLYPSLVETVKRKSLPSIANNFQILKAKYLKETGIYGAAMLGKSIL